LDRIELSPQRQGPKGSFTIVIASDENGRMFVNGKGNLTIAEVICGVELVKKELLQQGEATGVMGLHPKRF